MTETPQLEGIRFGDVRIEDVPTFWPVVEAHVAAACEYSDGDLVADEVLKTLLSGERMLWVAHDGQTVLSAVVTEVYDTPRKRICLILGAGGHPQVPWEWIATQIEAFAAERGCHQTRIVGRKGWERKLRSYRMTCVVLTRDLTHVQGQ